MLSLHRRIFNDDYNSSQIHSLNSSDSYNKAVLRHLLSRSPVSLIMISLIILMFIICQGTDISHGKYNMSVISSKTLLKYGANSNTLISEGQVYRIFTAMFLHSGVLHLIANMSSFFLYLMPVQSKTISRLLYICVLFVGGMFGNIFSNNVYNLRGKNLLAVGSSTAICSVIGFDFAFRILRVDDRPLQSRRIIISLSYIFLISLMPGVDFFGHFGSLFGGFFFGTAFLRASEDFWGENGVRKISLGGIVCLTVYAVILVAWFIKSSFFD